MNERRKRKLLFVLGGIFVTLIVSALVLYALRQNISLFYTPSDVHAGLAKLNTPVRVGGMVVAGSVVRSNNLQVSFQLSDMHHTLDIHYDGILPDLFREGQGIVAYGRLMPNGVFKASEVLAKHDEKYMPPEIKAAMMKNKT